MPTTQKHILNCIICPEKIKAVIKEYNKHNIDRNIRFIIKL